MKWTLGFLAALSLVLSSSAAVATAAAGTQPTTRPIGQFSTSELIDLLAKVGNDQFAVQTNIIAVGKDDLPKGLIKLQDEGPKPGEAMRELVRRGASVVPELAAHLDDARKTKAVVKGMLSGIHYSAEYDWNPRTGKSRPEGLGRRAFNGNEEKLRFEKHPDEGNQYTLAVGDLCFNLIGEIVNRDFNAVRYQPTAIVIVNSPVLCPDLREAVRNEWARLTPERHRELLIDDVITPDSGYRSQEGVIALWRYFPAAVPAAVRKRLDVGHYDFFSIRQFVDGTLLTNPNADERKRLIDEAVARNGPAWKDGLIRQLWDEKYLVVGQKLHEPGPAPTVRVAASTVLAELVPNFDPDYPPLVDSVDYRDTAWLIEAMKDIRSDEIDRAVWDTFRKHNASGSKEWENDDYIARDCIRRLVHRGYDPELIAFCERRSAQVQSEPDRKQVAELLRLLKNTQPDLSPVPEK